MRKAKMFASIKRIIKILHRLLTVILLFVILHDSTGEVWERETLLESPQPENIHYNGDLKYTLRIVKLKQILTSRNVLIVSSNVDPNYGHVVSYLDDYIFNKNDIKVTWSKDGVTVINELGTKIVIPTKNFIGLR